MQHISSNISPIRQSRGGRISSPKLRDTINQSQDFEGLEESVKHFSLLTLVKRAGKGAGFSSKMVELLEHYMIFTREIDWQQGSQPIVYKSQEQTAMDLDITVRHVRRLEKELFDAGALTWIDSGNHKRYGQRCPDTGRIIYAYGVDLTPLAYLKSKLEEIIHEQQLYKAAWMETKRQISWHRSQVKSVLAEMTELEAEGQGAFLSNYEEIATRYDTRMSLEGMRSMLGKHQELYNRVLEALDRYYKDNKTNKESCRTDSNDLHKQNTNKKLFNKLNTDRRDTSHCFQEKRNGNIENKAAKAERPGRPEPTKGRAEASQPYSSKHQKPQDSEDRGNLLSKAGLQHITVKQVLNAGSQRFKDHIPLQQRPMDWEDVVEAAYALRPSLHISQQSWANACQVLTKYGAAICLLLVDQAAQRPENPVRKPAAYFNTMISRARAGELHLHRSIFGLLKRETEALTANDISEPSSQRRS